MPIEKILQEVGRLQLENAHIRELLADAQQQLAAAQAKLSEVTQQNSKA